MAKEDVDEPVADEPKEDVDDPVADEPKEDVDEPVAEEPKEDVDEPVADEPKMENNSNKRNMEEMLETQQERRTIAETLLQIHLTLLHGVKQHQEI